MRQMPSIGCPPHTFQKVGLVLVEEFDRLGRERDAMLAKCTCWTWLALEAGMGLGMGDTLKLSKLA